MEKLNQSDRTRRIRSANAASPNPSATGEKSANDYFRVEKYHTAATPPASRIHVGIPNIVPLNKDVILDGIRLLKSDVPLEVATAVCVVAPEVCGTRARAVVVLGDAAACWADAVAEVAAVDVSATGEIWNPDGMGAPPTLNCWRNWICPLTATISV